MSTIVAVKKAEKVVIGADTQITWGDTKKTPADCKFTKIIKYKNYGFFGLVGLLAFDIPLQMFLAQYDIKKVNKYTLFELLCEFVNFAKTKHLIKSSSDDTEFFSAYDFLFCDEKNIYHADRQRGIMLMNRFWAIGSGCELALGSLQSLYNTNLTAKQLTEKSLSVASYFDVYSDAKKKHIMEIHE